MLKYKGRRIKYGYLSRSVFWSMIIVQIFALSVAGQEKQGVSYEEFRNQFLSALEGGNQQIAEQLVQHNREHAKRLVGTLLSRGAVSQQTGELSSALEWYTYAHELCRRLGNRQGEAEILNYIGVVYVSMDSLEQALSRFREALDIANEIGDQRGEGTACINIGGVYRENSSFPRALEYCQKGLNLVREIGDVEAELTALNCIAEIYEDSADYRSALPYYQQALNIAREIGDSTAVAVAFYDIGRIHEATGEYQHALSHFEEALKITRGIGNYQGELAVLNWIAELHYHTGDYDKSLSYCSKALSLAQEIEDKRAELSALITIAAVHEGKADYIKALSYSLKSLNLARKIGDRHGEKAALNNIGSVYFYTGDYPQALEHYLKATAIQGTRDEAAEGTVLHNIGMIYESTADFKQALQYYQEALTITREIGHKQGEARTLSDIGRIYEVTGKRELAMRFFEDALTIRKKIGDKQGQGTDLNNMGAMFRNVGDYQQALSYYWEALAIRREIGDRRGEAETLHNIGVVYDDVGEYQQALSFSQKAVNIASEIGDESGEGTYLNSVGYVYMKIGEYQQALDCFQRVLRIARDLGDKLKEYVGLAHTGRVHEEQQNWVEAITWYKQSIKVFEEIRGKAGVSRAKESFFEEYGHTYRYLVKALARVNSSSEAFHYVERSKARSFVELLHEASVRIKKGIDDSLLQEESSLHRRLFEIEEALKGKLSDEQLDTLLEEQKTLEHEQEILTQKIKLTNRSYAELKYPGSVTMQEVQDSILKEGEVLVEYLWGEEEIYVFVIGKNGFYTYTVKMSYEDLIEKVTDLIDDVREVSRGDFDVALAHEIYDSLFLPLEEKIALANGDKSVRTLIIVPDGVLHYLPFEMLVIGLGESYSGNRDAGTEYLVHRYSVVYAPCATALKPSILHHEKAESYERELLALTPFSKEEDERISESIRRAWETLPIPQTVRNHAGQLRPLYHAAEEVEKIGRYYYPNSLYRTGGEATESFLRVHSTGNRYLHLATHGYLDREQPMYSGLELSDGMLQTYEIFNMDIDAELAVLSACQTGLGQFKEGEGLVGLSRAFFYAGTPSLLVSLWSVSDPSTAEFMTQFYKNLRRGMNKAEALRETKESMIKEYHADEFGNKTSYGHPFYWAPFILIGAHE